MKHFMNIVPVAGLAAFCMAVCLCSCAGHKDGDRVAAVSSVAAVAKADCDGSGLGEPVEVVYEGMTSSVPVCNVSLAVRHRRNSGDGVFRFAAVCAGDTVELVEGKRYTQRGIPGDNDATVWQFVSSGRERIFNYLVKNDSVLVLLDDKFQVVSDADSLSLEKVKQQGLSQRFAPAVETPHEF